jgi:GST-like protein
MFAEGHCQESHHDQVLLSPVSQSRKDRAVFEETGLPYQLIPVDTRRGEQHDPAFLQINPNAKTPALVDGDTIVFDSNAMLLYLAEKTGKFYQPMT